MDIFRFADGTEIVADAIEPTGLTVIGDDAGGYLYGTSGADTLIGGDGDDKALMVKGFRPVGRRQWCGSLPHLPIRVQRSRRRSSPKPGARRTAIASS